MTNNEKNKKFSNMAPAIVFLVIIALFFLGSLIIKDKDFSDNENRNLQTLPEMSMKSIADGTYTEKFETYVQDQFPLRDRLMSFKTGAEKLMGRHDNGLVYFGKDDYLFSIETLNEEQLRKNVGYVTEFVEKEGARCNIEIMIVPSAYTVLSDKLPSNAEVPDENKAIDYVYSKATESGALPVDVRDTLGSHAEDYIYYRTDHHWTTYGAYCAYEKFAVQNMDRWISPYGEKGVKAMDNYERTVLSDSFLGTNYSKAMLSSIKPDTMEKISMKFDPNSYHLNIYEASGELEKEFDTLYDESYLDKKDKYSCFLSGNNPLIAIGRTGEPVTGRNILVVKDSYSHCFIPFIASDYDNVIAVDMRYYRNGLHELVRQYGITDVLFLYNILNFSNDTNLVFANNDKPKTVEKAEITEIRNSDELSEEEVQQLYQVYDNSLIIGDSRTEGMKYHSGIQNADFFCAKAVAIDGVAAGATAQVGGKMMSVYGLLNSKQYNRIYIALGMNNLGGRGLNNFIQQYDIFIQKIKEIQPDAEIYLQTIFPVNSGFKGIRRAVNNDNIAAYNAEIASLAERYGVKCLNPEKPLIDENGNLKAEATSDGVHLNAEYCRKWAIYLAQITY